jgi:hypothetical protein
VLRSLLDGFGRKARRDEGHLRIGMCEDRLFLSTGQEIAFEKGAGAEWRAALDALPAVLREFRRHKASLILADQFVRYALLPWSDTLRTHAQWQALAQHRFRAIHGPLADEWEIKFAETAPAGPRLACAAERALVDALTECFGAADVHLVAVQPFLVTAFNQVRRTLLAPGSSCWLVVEEPGRLTLAFLQHGRWVAIRSRRCENGGESLWRRVLPQIIERESALLGLQEPCTRVVVCAQGEFDAGEHEEFRTEALSYHDLALAKAA